MQSCAANPRRIPGPESLGTHRAPHRVSEAKARGNWLAIVSKLASGQVVVQGLNLLTAMLLLRLLPLSEYGLFVAANALVVLASVNSDLGLSMGFTTYGARRRDTPSSFDTLYRAVMYLRRRLFTVVAVTLIIAAPLLLRRQITDQSSTNVLGLSLIYALLALGIAWTQLNSNLRIAVLNMRHDSVSLSKCLIIGAATRLVFSVIFCWLWPNSIAAVIAVLFSTGLTSWSLRRYVRSPQGPGTISIEDDKKQLWTFVSPLILSSVYFALQGQLSVLLTTLFAPSTAVAQVGALTRLGQIIAFFNIFHSFLFQPLFARISSRREFVVTAIKMFGLITLVSAPLLLSAAFFPDLWLLLLGKRYAGLGAEVLLALAAPITTYYVNFIFIILSARGFTKGQWMYVIVSLVVQATFLSHYGMDSTHKALLLGFATAVATVLLQLALLVRLLRDWR